MPSLPNPSPPKESSDKGERNKPGGHFLFLFFNSHHCITGNKSYPGTIMSKHILSFSSFDISKIYSHKTKLINIYNLPGRCIISSAPELDYKLCGYYLPIVCATIFINNKGDSKITITFIHSQTTAAY